MAWAVRSVSAVGLLIGAELLSGGSGIAEGAEGRAPLTGGVIGTQKKLGIGLQSGSVSGLSVKYFLSSSTALQAALGGSPWWGYGVNLEYLVHPFVLANASGVAIPLYIGVGLGFGQWYYHDYAGINVHVPLGIALEFKEFPLDIFLQVEPGLGAGPGYVGFVGAANLGARLYF